MISFSLTYEAELIPTLENIVQQFLESLAKYIEIV